MSKSCVDGKIFNKNIKIRLNANSAARRAISLRTVLFAFKKLLYMGHDLWYNFSKNKWSGVSFIIYLGSPEPVAPQRLRACI